MEARRILAELGNMIVLVSSGKVDRPGLAKRLRRLADAVEKDAPKPEPKADPHRETALRLFEFWRERCGKGANTKPTPERLRAVSARLRDGYTEADIRLAIEGAAVGAFETDEGRRFDDLTLICRNGAKLEDFRERAGGEAVDVIANPRLRELEEDATKALREKRIDDYNRLQDEIRREQRRGSAPPAARDAARAPARARDDGASRRARPRDE